jgi:hypothetical protein
MADHLTTLFQYVDEIEELDRVQGWINEAREAAPTNQVVQLNLDRQQSELDRRRAFVALMMADIRNRN